MGIVRFPTNLTDLFWFLLDWAGNFTLLSGLCLPVYLVMRGGARGVLAGALCFWVFIVVTLYIHEFGGDDMDLAPGCYLVAGWLVGGMYCLPPLAIVCIWRQWRPNPLGYCRRCGRAVKPDRICCRAGHDLIPAPRGFEVKLMSPGSGSREPEA